jgi:4-diphosphocytidyl-2-C-methyl-D-erythritol kinase
VAVATRAVFAALRLLPRETDREPPAPYPTTRAALIAAVAGERNDLEPPAKRLAPVIADVLAQLAALEGCALARMSGSGATCFGLFGSGRAAAAAARMLRRKHPAWWVRATVFGGVRAPVTAPRGRRSRA